MIDEPLLDAAHHDDYEAFLEKFKAKKTTDDCYTPQPVYDAVLQTIAERIDLSGKRILRPFYPGGDYKSVAHVSADVVIDNPPFSIITQIVRHYVAHRVPFFVFAPALTLFSPRVDGCTYIVTNSTIEYANGAVVATAFISNMFGDTLAMTWPLLSQRIDEAQASEKPSLPRYIYPAEVLTVNRLQKIVSAGIEYSVPRQQARFITKLESQAAQGKTIFGTGLIVSEAAAKEAAAKEAAAKEAAAKEAAATREAVVWPLPDREKRLVSHLSGKEPGTPLFPANHTPRP